MKLDFLNVTNEKINLQFQDDECSLRSAVYMFCMNVAYVVLSTCFVQKFPGFHIQGQKSKKSA